MFVPPRLTAGFEAREMAAFRLKRTVNPAKDSWQFARGDMKQRCASDDRIVLCPGDKLIETHRSRAMQQAFAGDRRHGRNAVGSIYTITKPLHRQSIAATPATELEDQGPRRNGGEEGQKVRRNLIGTGTNIRTSVRLIEL